MKQTKFQKFLHSRSALIIGLIIVMLIVAYIVAPKQFNAPNLKQILSIADLVKFAKYQPLADENQLSFMNAKMFVEQTKKIEIEEPVASEDDESEATI